MFHVKQLLENVPNVSRETFGTLFAGGFCYSPPVFESPHTAPDPLFGDEPGKRQRTPRPSPFRACRHPKKRGFRSSAPLRQIASRGRARIPSGGPLSTTFA